MNSANYGRLTYGAEMASEVYYGKAAADLTLLEAAILASIAEAPALNPHDAPEAALERGREAIARMVDQGWIDQVQAEEAIQTEVNFRPPQPSETNPSAAFAQLTLKQLGQQYDLARLERGGFRVISSLDYNMQFQTMCAVAALHARLNNQPEPTQTDAGDECRALQYLSFLPQQEDNQSGDLDIQAIIMDPTNGKISAMVATSPAGIESARPPGTLLTPFIYLAGFTRGMSPATLLWDVPAETSSIQNPDSHFHGPVRLRIALANDYLTPAEQVLSRVGAQNVEQIARDMGIAMSGANHNENLSEFTGGNRVTLLDMTHAFSALANQGILAGMLSGKKDGANGQLLPEPVAFLSLEDVSGTSWVEENNSFARPVIGSQLAYLLTQVLSDEPARWPSLGHPNPLEIGRPVAAKIGQTANEKDAWTVGYTPQSALGVWIGAPEGSSTERVPVSAATGLWQALFQYVNGNLPPQTWNIPAGITSAQVCDPSGLLPTSNCPSLVDEIFLTGNEPTQVDNLYNKIAVNRETDRLATVFTPPEFVEERVYMIVPPEASEWARQAGIPIPPGTYDTIPANLYPPDVNITAPEMFAYVNSTVAVKGNASGENFDFYRLQVGSGLNPKTWVQIGEDEFEPVTDGVLGVWDTQGLSGLYAIQLLVIRADQRVDTAILQVTVDNQPPDIQILSPGNGQVIERGKDSLTLSVLASDDLALQTVDYFIDGHQVASRSQAPFSVLWVITPGRHEFKAIAIDQAGNSQSTAVNFSVKN